MSERQQLGALLVQGGLLSKEALDAALVDRWLTHAPGTHIFNEYGPTETVVGCSVHELVAGQPLTDPVPIGRPIAIASSPAVTR